MSTPGHASTDHVVDSVDWLPSGASSGLIRVRGHSRSGAITLLPELVMEAGGESRRLVSLPDPRAVREPGTWRGAYVLDARPDPEDGLWLSWPDGSRVDLPGSARPTVAAERPAVTGASSEGGDVVDRAVLAERRVRRAEASEQAQARIAKEALRAVEVLELRAQELEADRDALRVRAEESETAAKSLYASLTAASDAEPVVAAAPAGDADAEVERLRMALDLAQRDAAVDLAKLHSELEDARAALAAVTVEDSTPLRSALADAENRAGAAEAQAARLRAELDRAMTAPLAGDSNDSQRTVLLAERRAVRLRSALTATIATVAELRLRLHEADVSRRSREVGHSADAVRLTILDAEHARLKDELEIRRTAMDDLAAAQAALEELRALHAEQGRALAESQERVAGLEAELARVRGEAEQRVAEALASAQAVADSAAGDQIAAAQALTAEAERVAEELRTELADAQTAREVAEAGAAAVHLTRAAEGVRAAAPLPEHSSLSEQLDRARESLRAAREAAAQSADRWSSPLAAMQAAATPAAAAPEPAVAEPEVVEPEPVAVEPEPVAVEPEPEIVEPEPVAAEPEPEPEVAEPEPVAAAPDLGPEFEAIASEPEPEVVEPAPELTEPELEEAVAIDQGAAPTDVDAVEAETLASQAVEAEATDAGFAPPVANDVVESLTFEEVPHIDADAPQATRSPVAPFPLELLGAAQRQADAAETVQPTEEQAKVVADLDAAAAKLRNGPEIISPTDDPPNDLARGRGSVDYPPLRGALVKLAHDDPAAAAKLIVGLLSAKHNVLGDPLDWDLSISELGTYAMTFAPEETTVVSLDRPRGRPHAAFHLKGDAVDVAEALAGVGDRPSRMRGGLRTSGRVRDARRLLAVTNDPPPLADMLKAGADLDPALVVRAFTYTVPASWTTGQAWAVDLVVEGTPLGLVAQASRGLVHERPSGEPDARIHLDKQGFADLVAGVEQPLRIDGDKAAVGRLLALAERVRTGA